VLAGSGFEFGDTAWFLNGNSATPLPRPDARCTGQLNIAYNCVDRHLPKLAKQVRRARPIRMNARARSRPPADRHPLGGQQHQ
jgi:hypothetical protein